VTKPKSERAALTSVHGLADLALDLFNGLATIALVPLPV
jgi:hypothetical protein